MARVILVKCFGEKYAAIIHGNGEHMYFGGIVGSLENTNLYNAYNNGNISGEGINAYLGGIVGSDSPQCVIYNTYNI